MITEQQIRDMEPGRELDDAIRLMLGWTKFREKEDGTFACWVTPEGKQWTYPSSGTLPKYSTDISAAWEVFEILKSKFPWAGVETTKQGYRCLVIDDERDFEDGYGKTAPLAICRAALIAILRGGSGE